MHARWLLLAALSALLAPTAVADVKDTPLPEAHRCSDEIECLIGESPLPEEVKLVLISVYHSVKDVVCTQEDLSDPRVGVYVDGTCDTVGPRDLLP